MRWQKWARIILALIGLSVVVAVGLTFKRRRAPQAPAPAIVRTDPKAVVESTSGRAVRFNRAHEDIRVEYERQLTYADGSTKLLKAKIVADDRGDGRSFTLTGDEGSVEKDEAVVALNGHIRLLEADGFTAETGAATYDKRDSVVRAPGDIEFHHDRLSGSGHGMLYDKNSDVLTILERAVTHMAPNAAGTGAADITAGRTTFARMDHVVQFDGGVHVRRAAQVIDAGSAIAYLSDDDKRITVLELHQNATIAATPGSEGSLQGITGKDVTLEYADDGQALEHAAIAGKAVIKLSGGAGKPGREISANALDIKLAADGATPTDLSAQGAVKLTLPADEGLATRTVTAGMLTAAGDPITPERGLTQAHFTTNVEYREKSASVDRTAKAQRLDVGLKPAMAAFDSALFTREARFDDAGKVSGTAASVKYVADEGTLALSGSEANSPRPHVFNDQITVDAATVDVTLAGPVLTAKGDVKSVLQPPKKSSANDSAKLPSMLKQDQAVNVTADNMTFDGEANKATYDGRPAVLFQADTSIKAESIVIDSKSGDLTASGQVMTSTMLDQTEKDTKKKERVRSLATAKTFTYEDKARKASYAGDVHFSQAENDLAAGSVDLFLKESGNEIERAEASDASNGLVMREQGRRTTGSKMTFSAADDRYDVTGAPVAITDQCGRVTNGRTLTFKKATDTIEIDGNRRVRTQTKNGSKCQ
jgi:lipopolysaccharide export system protein LptA